MGQPDNCPGHLEVVAEMADKARKRPKTPSYSDIDLTRWREYDHVWTDSLWLIEARDRTGGHQLDYHGNFVPQIATQTYLRYTREDDIVLDLFLGCPYSVF